MNKKIVAIVVFSITMILFDYIDDKMDDDDNDDDDEKFTFEEIQKNHTCFKKKKNNKGTCIKNKGVCYKKQNNYDNSPNIPCSNSRLHGHNSQKTHSQKTHSQKTHSQKTHSQKTHSQKTYSHINDIRYTDTRPPVSQGQSLMDTHKFDGNRFYDIHQPFLVSGRNPDRPRECI